MRIDPDSLRVVEVYRLMTSALVPRPIAWVGTRSREGVDNLAPFSYFMGVSSRPPALAISVSRRAGGLLKDTARNILETGVFTVSIAGVAQAVALNATSADLPPDQSEFALAGLVPLDGERVAAPRPAEAAVSFECALQHALDLDSTHLIVGQVRLLHLDDAVIGPDGLVDAARLDPLARLGGADYAGLGEIFRLKRPGS